LGESWKIGSWEIPGNFQMQRNVGKRPKAVRLMLVKNSVLGVFKRAVQCDQSFSVSGKAMVNLSLHFSHVGIAKK